ncbi:hypothetical protein Sjap_011923 [Stephania japonica]|uniref:Uncharacterized protein n=1 Tax=Stephania japonica TaxID=461633 RepID=A0AAP0JC84_9MAGN
MQSALGVNRLNLEVTMILMEDAVVPPPVEINSVVSQIVKCDCCELAEECTPEYIKRTRDQNQGKWICGLCGEAVRDEVFRSGRMISDAEALNRHMNFCKKFRSSCPPTNTSEHLISAVKQLLRRSLDSPKASRSTPSSPVKKTVGKSSPRQSLVRRESCFSTLAG